MRDNSTTKGGDANQKRTIYKWSSENAGILTTRHFSTTNLS